MPAHAATAYSSTDGQYNSTESMEMSSDPDTTAFLEEQSGIRPDFRPPMQYRRLGRSGLQVSVIGIGTNQLRRVPERQAVETLLRAFERGINLVNAEPEYEGALPLIRTALRERTDARPVHLTIQGGGSPAEFERVFEETCELFDTPCLDLFGISAISDQEAFGGNIWGPGGLVEFLQLKKQEGRIRGLFASDHGTPEQMKAILERDVFDVLMLALNPLGHHLVTFRAKTVWNFERPPHPIPDYEREDLFRTEREILPLARERDVGILVMKPLAGGLLCTGKAFPNHQWREQPLKPPAAPDILRHLLRNDAVTAVVPGMASVEEVEENVLAGDASSPLASVQRAALEAGIADLSRVLCSRCGECDDLCSRGLPVSYLFRAAYHYLFPNAPFGISTTLQYFRLHPWEEARCSSCTNQTCRCPFGIDIPGELIAIHAKMLQLRDKGMVPAADTTPEDWATGRLYSAKLLSCELPAPACALRGKAILHLRNTGATPWRQPADGDAAAVTLAVRIDDSPLPAIPLRQSVHPTGDGHFAFDFPLPQQPGGHALCLDLRAGSNDPFWSETLIWEREHFPSFQRKPPMKPYSVRYLEHNVTSPVVAGSRIVLRVQVENTGSEQWFHNPSDGHYAGLCFFIDEQFVSDARAAAPVVPPGGRAEFAITVTVPRTVGPCKFRFDMAICNKLWFRDAGNPPLEIPVEIVTPESTRTDALLDIAYRRNTCFFSPGMAIHRSRGKPVYPVFAETANGCILTDVDGRQYIDVMMGWGCSLLGYNEPRISEAVVQSVTAGGGVLSLPHRLEMEVTEALCRDFPWGDEAIFGKNGSDVTTWAARTARVATGRKTIVGAGYFGWQDWFVSAQGLSATGVPSGNNPYYVPIPYRDIAALESAAEANAADLAAIMIEPAAMCVDPHDSHHLTDSAFLRRARELADRYGALLVFDEVMTGFRFRGGSACAGFDVRADITCLGKGLANGFPLSGLVARGGLLRHHVGRIFYAPTMKGEVCSYAAALAALRIYQQDDVPGVVWSAGEQIRAGVASAAKQVGINAALIGPPYRMYLKFFDLPAEDDADVRLHTLVQQELARNGVISTKGYVIVSRAHDNNAIEKIVCAYTAALRTVSEAIASGSTVRFLDVPDLPIERRTVTE